MVCFQKYKVSNFIRIWFFFKLCLICFFFSWVWIIQDIMGISLSIYLISTVQFTSFKSITFLLVAFIVFDVLKMNLSITITQVDILKCSLFKEILRTSNGYFFLILELKFCWNGNKWCENCTLYRGNYFRLIGSEFPIIKKLGLGLT